MSSAITLAGLKQNVQHLDIYEWFRYGDFRNQITRMRLPGGVDSKAFAALSEALRQ